MTRTTTKRRRRGGEGKEDRFGRPLPGGGSRVGGGRHGRGGGGEAYSRYWRARCRSQWAGKVGLVRQKREGGRGETDSIP